MLCRYPLLSIVLLFFLCFRSQCHGVSGVPHGGKGEPWFTGPLLTPTARVISEGHVNIEPYLFYNVDFGKYVNHWKPKSTPKFYQINPQVQIKIGFWENFDLSVSPQSFCSWTQGRVGSTFGDLPIGIDYQLYKGGKDSWLTYAKFSVQEIFPTGKFQHLDPNKLGTDIGGGGTFATQIGFAFSKLTQFSEVNFLNVRWFIAATIPSPAHVKGYNVFGGGYGTRGTVYPGVSGTFQAGAEYSVTRNWTFACDIQINYAAKSRFKGRTVLPVGGPSSAQFSIAPAIEYNWSDTIGVIIGPWFTVAGRNAAQFGSLVAGLNMVF